MATTFVIACPRCEKQVKVSDEHIGKKVKCKDCELVYPIDPAKAVTPAKTAPPPPPKKGPPAPPKKGTPPPPPPKADAPLKMADDDEENADPYILTQTDDHLPRCPFCAKEMASEDAIICLHCGYNTRTRGRKEVTAVFEHTFGELFMWQLPAILCALFMIGSIVWYIIFWSLIEGWMKGGTFEESDGVYFAGVSPGMFRLYHGLLIAFVFVPLVRFCYKRFFVFPKPPEKKIKGE